MASNNPADYIKSSNLSPIDRLVTSAISNAISGSTFNAQQVAQPVAENYLNIGLSFSSVEAFAALQTDKLLSGALDVYYAFAGKSTSRTGATDISHLRRNRLADTKEYLAKINPATKIAKNRQDNEIEILTVV
jgi:hypothetical protein